MNTLSTAPVNTDQVNKPSDSWLSRLTLSRSMALKSLRGIPPRLFLPVVFSLLTTGCVSTEELYARYDQPDCNSGMPIESVAIAVVQQSPLWHWAILFPFNGSEVTPSQKLLLDDNLAVLNANPEYSVIIRGYTDSVASERYNLLLAKRRVASVIRWLEQQGVASHRINSLGMGETGFIQVPGTERMEDANRRVEMLLLDGQDKPVAFKGQTAPVIIEGTASSIVKSLTAEDNTEDKKSSDERSATPSTNTVHPERSRRVMSPNLDASASSELSPVGTLNTPTRETDSRVISDTPAERG